MVCIIHWMKMKFGKRIRIKEIVKGVWAFCSYLFVPQWGRRNSRDRIAVKGTKVEIWKIKT